MDSITAHLDAGSSLGRSLLESLRRMAASGHRPAHYLLLRLTDGRVRAIALSDESSSPYELIEQIRNESGPLSSAFVVGSGPHDGRSQVFVEDLLGGQGRAAVRAGFGGRELKSRSTISLAAEMSSMRNRFHLHRGLCFPPLTVVPSGSQL